MTSVFDANGRFAPQYDDDDVMTLDADACILAIGQRADLSFLTPERRRRPDAGRHHQVDRGDAGHVGSRRVRRR